MREKLERESEGIREEGEAREGLGALGVLLLLESTRRHGEGALPRATGVATEVGEDDRMVLLLGPWTFRGQSQTSPRPFIFLFYK